MEIKNKFLLSEIHSAATAAEIWGISYDTFKNQLKGIGKKDTIEKIEKCKLEGSIKKDGRIWLVSEQAMTEIFGERKQEG